MIGTEEIYPLAVEFRRYFHQHPEFAMQEVETQRYIAEVLEQNGIPYQKVGTGLIATVGKGEKCIAIRADMDALKVKEETGLSYCSQNEGMMHACGHDMHMAMVLGASGRGSFITSRTFKRTRSASYIRTTRFPEPSDRNYRNSSRGLFRLFR